MVSRPNSRSALRFTPTLTPTSDRNLHPGGLARARRRLRTPRAALGIGTGLALALALGNHPPQSRADDGGDSSRSTAAAPGEAAQSVAVEHALRSINDAIDVLSQRIQTLQARRAAAPKAEAAPDASDPLPLQGRLDQLAKAADGVPSLKSAADALEARVGALDAQLVEIRKQLDALKGNAAPQPSSEADVARAITLFKAAKYQEAGPLFRTLTESRPDDARVWYYAGLCHGLVSKTWEGETLRLVRQGVERERAGGAAKAQIDASLSAGVTDARLKDWLDSYRQAGSR